MKNKLNVVIDTNIFIRSWFDDYVICDQILDLVERNRVKLYFSQSTIGELVYIAKKYAIKNMSSKIPRMMILNKVMEIFYDAESVNTANTLCPTLNDEYDEMFLKCAIEGNVDYLISDDFKSGLHSVDQFNFKVVSSEKFVEIYESLSA